MPLSDANELRQEVRRFVAGGPLLPLREWVEDYDAPISESPDAAFRDLISDVWARISEHDLGERTESSVRAALAAQQECGERLGVSCSIGHPYS